MEQSIPFIFRGAERCIITVAAIVIAVFGYKLFVLGSKGSRSEVSIKSKVADFLMKGSAPGLFFIVCSCAILISALYTGKVTADIGGKVTDKIINADLDKLSQAELKEIIVEFRESRQTNQTKLQSSNSNESYVMNLKTSYFNLLWWHILTAIALLVSIFLGIYHYRQRLKLCDDKIKEYSDMIAHIEGISPINIKEVGAEYLGTIGVDPKEDYIIKEQRGKGKSPKNNKQQ